MRKVIEISIDEEREQMQINWGGIDFVVALGVLEWAKHDAIKMVEKHIEHMKSEATNETV